jgi:uncharacterized protein involved in outer membrane biogenesis
MAKQRRKSRAVPLILAGVLVLAGLVLAVPWLVPLSSYIPRIEQAASSALGLPVKVGTLRLHLLPAPHAIASGIEVGARDLRVGTVSAWPELGSLLSETKVIRLIEVDGLSVRDALFARLPARSKDKSPPAVQVRHVTVKDLRPEFGGKAAGVWRADLALGGPGGGALGVARADLASEDGHLKARLAPSDRAGVWSLAVDAKDWKPPLGPPLQFASLSLRGSVTETLLDLPEVKAALYGGTLNGRVRLDYPARWVLAGHYALQDVDVAALAKAFTPTNTLGGSLRSEGQFDARAASVAALSDALRLDGRFSIASGVLNGFDLANAAGNLLKGGTKGGQTRFDHLDGKIQVVGATVKLRQLVVSSGVLEARGNVDLVAGSKLDGIVDVELKQTKGLVGVPLALSGTVKDPVISPTKGSAIGAAVGTVLLPGVGTGLGSSVGRFFEKKTSK